MARWCGVLLGALLFACGPGDEAGAERATVPEVVLEEGLPPVPDEKPDAARWSAGMSSGISSPFDISKPVLKVRPTARSGVGVAFDGRQYLVVWEDDRSGNVFGARVRPDGKILDPAGIPLNLATGLGGGEPRVAWDGKQFVVAWVDGGRAVGVHVERDGEVRRRFVIGPSDTEGGLLELACAKKLCLVTYATPGDGGVVVFAARVDSEGEVLDFQALSPRGNVARNPAVAWDGRRFLVVWSDERGGPGMPDLYGRRVETDGSVLDGDGVPLIALPGAQTVPAVTWTGSRFLLVWQDDRGGTADIFGARLRRDLSVDGPAGFPISTGPGEQTEPRVAPSGSKSLVVWDDTRLGPHRVRGVRVGDDGRVLGPSTGFAISSGDSDEERQPAVAAGDGQFFVAFAGAESGVTTGEANLILGTRVRHDDTVKDSPALRFTRSATPQDLPAAAFGESSYLVVWREVREGSFQLMAARVRPDGRRLGEPIVLPSDLVVSRPAVAWDGNVWLVVWDEAEAGDLRGARVSGSGKLLDTTSLVITDLPANQLEPAVASNSDGFLVVWMDGRGASTDGFFDIVGTRVTSSGTVLDPEGILISPRSRDQENPSVVAVGDGRYLVAWVNREFSSNPFSIASSIRGARVAADGTVLDTPDLLFSTGSVLAARPALAWDGTNTLVAWSSAPEGIDFPGLGVFATRVDADGHVLDAPPITVAAPVTDAEQAFVSATFDGRDFWLAWQVTRFPPSTPPEELLTDVFGTRVRTDGTVRDPGGQALAAHQPEPEFESVLASSADGRAALFYTEFVTEEDVMNLRIQGRVLTGAREPSVPRQQ